MTIEKLTAEARALLTDARALAEATSLTVHDVAKVSTSIYLSATHAEAARWSTALVAMMDALSGALDDLAALQAHGDMLMADLALAADKGDPAAAEARILVGAADNETEAAGAKCLEYGHIAELAADRVAHFHEFRSLQLEILWDLSIADSDAADAKMERLERLAFDLATIATDAELDNVRRRRAMLNHPSNGRNRTP